MSKSKKSQYGKSLSTFLCLFLLAIIASPVSAVDLPFDPNDFTFLVYDPGGLYSRIEAAMEQILDRELDPSEIRNSENEVTPNDLTTHDILIVGWNDNADTTGLDDETLAAGITGRVILTGHDADFHTVHGPNAAEVFLVQAIDWVLKGDGTGMITLGCTSAFPYLPEFWDVNAYANGGQDVNEFTEEGLASGVYDDLVPGSMSNWGQSYHDIFTIEQYSFFVPFELGGDSDNDIITIACDKIKLPCFYIKKEVNDVNCVSPLISQAEHELLGTPYNWLYYNIHYDANGFADTDVNITDHLPAEVNYISSDPCGYYDPCKHTVTWEIPVMSASDSNTFWIQVGVNHYARPGETITNLCEIEGDLYYAFTTWPTDICCYGGDIIYVDANANGFNNGTSWLNAYIDLQDALTGATNCDCEQIRVAQQTYMPTDIEDTSARSISFELLDNVAVYGGFPPGGGTWPQRNPNVYETILSGDIGTPDYKYDNSYHVVKCQDVNNATLDGFTITAGNADVDNSDPCCGGGIYNYNSSYLTIRYCTFSENSAGYGAAVFNNSSDANITNCIFNDNTATWWGGAMYNCYEPSPAMVACVFRDNTAKYGGGIYNNQSSPIIINCTFSGNSATTGVYTYGGAIYNTNSSDPNITNCTFSDNSADEGGAVYNYYDSCPNITNCVFNGNTADSFGGGMVNSNESSPTIINCTFSGNTVTTVGDSYGGAICNWDSSDPNISNCIFTENDANMGGGLYNNSSSPNMTNCIFIGNTADSYGGGMYNYLSSPTVTNCIFCGNYSPEGGGINNTYQSDTMLTNCTFSGNRADKGGGLYNYWYSDPDVTNCIFWDNAATVDHEIYNDVGTSNLNVTFCDVNGGWAGDGNIDKDPCFFEVEQPDGSWTENASYDNSTFQSTLTDDYANWAVNELAGKFVSPNTPQLLQFFIVSNDVYTIKVWSDVRSIAGDGDTYKIYDYHLRVESACIDRGFPDGDYNGQTDIDGEPRLFDGDANGSEIVDMGADEYYWSPADFDSDGFVNFFDYAFFSSAWQTIPTHQDYNDLCDLVDNDFIDSNDLARFCEDWLWQTAWAKAFPFSYGRGMGKSMGMGMGETFFPSIQAKQALPELTAADIEQILKWLADLWLTDDEVRKMISEDDWLKFIESLKQVLKELINN